MKKLALPLLALALPALALAGQKTMPLDRGWTLQNPSAGGNAGDRVRFIGTPQIKIAALGAGTNGTTETTSYVDDSPTGEYAPIDADVTEAADTSVYRVGTTSYKAVFAATAAANDGFKATITTDDLEANESIGMWIRASEACSSGDLQILLTDDGGARNYNIGALSAGVWTWVEVDISGLTGGTGDVVTEFGITLTTAGATAHGAFNVWLDVAYKWDADDEEALSTAIYQDGVCGVLSILTAENGVNTFTSLVEYTDYLTHYESGVDFLVWISDQSARSNAAIIAYP